MTGVPFKANRAYPSIPAVGGDTGSHTVSLKAVREAIETHERRTGNKLDSFVRVRELVQLGILKIEGDQIVVPQLRDFADDAAAAEGGIAIGELYHHGGIVHVRLAPAGGEFAYIATTSLGASANTATFIGADIGDAAVDRKVIVAFKCIQNGAVVFSPTMTIAGNAALRDVTTQSLPDINGNTQSTAIFSLDIAAGSTATIVVSFPGVTLFDAIIDVYRAVGLAPGGADDTAVAGVTSTNVGTLPPVHLDVDVVTGSVVVASAIAYEFASPNATWNGLTGDNAISIYGNDIRAAASHKASSTEAPRDVTVEFPAFTAGGLANVYQAVAASYLPA